MYMCHYPKSKTLLVLAHCLGLPYTVTAYRHVQYVNTGTNEQCCLEFKIICL